MSETEPEIRARFVAVVSMHGLRSIQAQRAFLEARPQLLSIGELKEATAVLVSAGMAAWGRFDYPTAYRLLMRAAKDPGEWHVPAYRLARFCSEIARLYFHRGMGARARRFSLMVPRWHRMAATRLLLEGRSDLAENERGLADELETANDGRPGRE